MTTDRTFDLTPDPKVLVALTRTPLSPLDALCELIDNSIDGFTAGSVQGVSVVNPIIAIALPSRGEIRDGRGALQVRDNGPGMTAEVAEKSIRAGFSGNNPYDSLGLFGMGFNIATGKLGRVTSLHTCRPDENEATEVSIELERIQKNHSFRVPYKRVPKQLGFAHGTAITISSWWPSGDANHGFVGKLVQYGIPSIEREIGRRYATILRGKKVRIVINDRECHPFEHCVWSDARFVERRGHGQIPAVYRFNEVIGHQRRCASCTAVVDAAVACPECGGHTFRKIEERIKGWVGIQRFDSQTEYGIDLIRNGRAIRIAEKGAFFEFEDEFKRVTKDYPIDSQYGRIVGEVSIDHVPVDFLKQDFQRSSPEWARAIHYLRGASSLQPQMLGERSNDSPVYKLFQGYRRVRTPGKTDLYMGYWDTDEERPKRISREKEKELREQFEDRLPGYFDDSEWWKLVVAAEEPPLLQLSTCAGCGAQNPADAEICQVCNHVLRGQACVNPECNQVVAPSMPNCPACGTRQAPEEETPWACAICQRRNASGDVDCRACGAAKTDADPLREDSLLQDSELDEALSRRDFSFRLPDGALSQPIDIEVLRVRRGMIPWGQTERLAVFRIANLASCRIFMDVTHPLFRAYRVPPEAIVAQSVADQLLAMVPRPGSSTLEHFYTQTSLTAFVLRALVGQPENPEEVLRQSAKELIEAARERLPSALGEDFGDFMEGMPEEEKRELVLSMIAGGADIGRLPDMILSGAIANHIGPLGLLRCIEEYPKRVFDGRLWRAPYARLEQLPESLAAQQQLRTRRRFAACLQEIIEQRDQPDADPAIRDRAHASLRFLRSQLS
jgi:ribosomal protein L40E